MKGKTHKDAARLLGWPEGTLSVRLMRAKQMLANRLTRRNLGLGASSLSAILSPSAATASVSPTLISTTAKAASLFAVGNAQVVETISAQTAALAEGVLKAMFATKIQSALAIVLLIGSMLAGGALSVQYLNAQPQEPQARDNPNPLVKEKKNLAQAATPQERPNFGPALPAGAIARIGELPFRTGGVRASAMGPDNRSLFLRTTKGIHVHDLETGLSVRTIPATDKLGYAFYAIALSKDGSMIASLGRDGVFIWDAITGKTIRSLDTKWLGHATFSPDGKKLAAPRIGDAATGIRVFDVTTGREEYCLAESQKYATQILFTPDGKQLITASPDDNSILVSDCATKKIVQSLHIEGARTPLIALSPDGTTLAITDVRTTNDNPPIQIHTMRFVDLATGFVRAVAFNEVPDGQHMAMVYSPDGASVAISVGNTKCQVIDVVSGKTTHKFPCDTHRIHFTPDSGRIVMPDQVIRVWDLGTNRELHPPTEPMEPASSIAVSPDGGIVASRGPWTSPPKSPILCWNASTGQPLKTIAGNSNGSSLNDLAFAPNGQLVAGGVDGTVQFWNLDMGKKTAQLKPVDFGEDVEPLRNTVTKLAFDGRTVVTACVLPKSFGKGKIRLFVRDSATGKLLGTTDLVDKKLDEVLSRSQVFVEFSPDCRFFVGLSGDDLCLKNILTGEEQIKFRPNAKPDLRPDTIDANFLERTARFSADGQTIALVGARLYLYRQGSEVPGIKITDTYSIAIFDRSTGKERLRIPIQGFQPKSYAMSPDGQRVASTTGVTAKIWDTATGKVLWELPETCASVTCLAFSADGNRFVTAHDDTTILVWDVSSTNPKAKSVP